MKRSALSLVLGVHGLVQARSAPGSSHATAKACDVQRGPLPVVTRWRSAMASVACCPGLPEWLGFLGVEAIMPPGSLGGPLRLQVLGSGQAARLSARMAVAVGAPVAGQVVVPQGDGPLGDMPRRGPEADVTSRSGPSDRAMAGFQEVLDPQSRHLSHDAERRDCLGVDRPPGDHPPPHPFLARRRQPGVFAAFTGPSLKVAEKVLGMTAPTFPDPDQKRYPDAISQLVSGTRFLV